ncbi:MAG: hypothetical protein K1X72_16355 [Pyrinomonadaceae bacterium]|nr:hypothetical protein [Pyrinomonadaceae bacterium]
MPVNTTHSSLSITPFGAGDLIDRAVRFYRNNFWTFVWIAAPPILVGTLISIGWTMLGREFLGISAKPKGDEAFFAVLFTGFGNLVIWFWESVAVLIIMGGASRNFVRHILFAEKISFKETYANARSRFFGLLFASILIVFILGLIGFFIIYFGLILVVLLIMLIVAAFSFSPLVATIISVIFGVAGAFGVGWVFFLIASRFAYVPQIMLVEGQGIGSAMGRSMNLASGNVKRIYALFGFTILATYSALLLFYVPLGWYAYLNGIEIFRFDADALPAWYMIARQVISQASLILMMPIWMIGLCLLYVDERVRHEGYDIELMAARNLGEIPAVPRQYSNPLQPALANQSFVNPPNNNQSSSNSSITTLGLNG